MKLFRGFYALSFAALALCTTAASYVLSRFERAAERWFLWLAAPFKPLAMVEGWGGDLAVAGPSTYAAPPVHELRHEAGTSRRAAARNT